MLSNAVHLASSSGDARPEVLASPGAAAASPPSLAASRYACPGGKGTCRGRTASVWHDAEAGESGVAAVRRGEQLRRKLHACNGCGHPTQAPLRGAPRRALVGGWGGGVEAGAHSHVLMLLLCSRPGGHGTSLACLSCPTHAQNPGRRTSGPTSSNTISLSSSSNSASSSSSAAAAPPSLASRSSRSSSLRGTWKKLRQGRENDSCEGLRRYCEHNGQPLTQLAGHLEEAPWQPGMGRGCAASTGTPCLTCGAGACGAGGVATCRQAARAGATC